MKDNEECKGERKKLIIAIIGMVVVFLSFCGWLINISVERALYNRFEDRGLPRINIDLNGVSLETIKEGSKEEKYQDNALQIYDKGIITGYNGVEIKGRGNLSWEQPKKSYQIKFSRSVSLFGLKKSRKWALISNALDKSYIRNDAAFMFADFLEMEFNQRGEFVEVYFNGEYEGMYYLLRKIEIAKNSVDLRKDGSLLFELDNLHNKGECYWTLHGDCLVLKDYVERGDNLGDSVEKFLLDFNNLEKMAEEGDYKSVKEIADIDSLVDYYLVNEFVVDPDSFSSSFYIYRDGIDGKIKTGPIWDYDLAFGNKAWGWEQVKDSFYLPTGIMARRDEAFGWNGLSENKSISKLFYYLMDIDEFRDAVSKEYSEKIHKRKDEYLAMIDSTLDKIQKAAELDIAKWSQKDFQFYADKLLEWIKGRFDYFEQEFDLDDSSSINML